MTFLGKVVYLILKFTLQILFVPKTNPTRSPSLFPWFIPPSLSVFWIRLALVQAACAQLLGPSVKCVPSQLRLQIIPGRRRLCCKFKTWPNTSCIFRDVPSSLPPAESDELKLQWCRRLLELQGSRKRLLCNQHLVNSDLKVHWM